MIFSSHATSPWEEWRGARCPACAWSRGSPRPAGPSTSRPAGGPWAGCTCPEQERMLSLNQRYIGQNDKTNCYVILSVSFCHFWNKIQIWSGGSFKDLVEEIWLEWHRWSREERRRIWRIRMYWNYLQKHFIRGDLLRLSASGIK